MNINDFFHSLTTRGQMAPANKKASRRKPQHGHRTRAARRTLGKPWTGTVVHAVSRVGDPATGRVETASQRKHRRRTESRCRAVGHLTEGRLACRCGEVTADA